MLRTRLCSPCRTQTASVAKTGEMCSCFLLLVKMCIAVFWTSWSFVNDAAGQPASNMLQLNTMPYLYNAFNDRFCHKTALLRIRVLRWAHNLAHIIFITTTAVLQRVKSSLLIKRDYTLKQRLVLVINSY